MSMTVSLGSMEEFVREKVAQGDYRSVEEVLCAGLRLLQRQDDAWKADVRQKIEEGLADVRAGRVVDGEEAFARVFAWIEKQEKAGGA
jgi:putative addiction module CopG family antidote